MVETFAEARHLDALEFTLRGQSRRVGDTQQCTRLAFTSQSKLLQRRASRAGRERFEQALTWTRCTLLENTAALAKETIFGHSRDQGIERNNRS